LPTISVEEALRRSYPEPLVFSSILGYVGLPSAQDLSSRPDILTRDFVGKAGVELFYDDFLRGQPGEHLVVRDARGGVTHEEEVSGPIIGETLSLTIDGDLQRYFFSRLKSGLVSLGRSVGVGIALDPRSGEVLALISLPSYDAEILGLSGHYEEKRKILNSGLKPLFNRAISGNYPPGSTIKPLHGVAVLSEETVNPLESFFSPGYLDIPNPYDVGNPTRYLDWRYQGDVDLSSAIAKSSNVYFYTVVGGTENKKGLGISKLHEWWGRFGLGSETNIDFPGEARGFLPTPEWREETFDRPWLLGDTYNVAIGQGDLLTTPLQIINYIAAIANGGRLLTPVMNSEREHPIILRDLSYLSSEIREVQIGMREAVTSSFGTAKIMADLPIDVAGKTGSSQIQNNSRENAFFVGYGPYKNPEIVILVLVENAIEGSLNATPIAKDVFAWYYENRLKK